uniref:HD domain-containing protein n=1 Tax=Streptomyces antibioticus TaxID=1890 RepID=Q0R4Q1_STRAT|nr:unknown [Streptomyces antibioticus]
MGRTRWPGGAHPGHRAHAGLALNGTIPPTLARRSPRPRRGPVAVAPQLAAADRGVFFDRLRDTTEAAARQGEDGVLHRQALYLASYDRGPDAAAWTAHTLHRRRDVPARRGWSPRWAEARSTATALALLGGPQPLLDFIDRALADDTHKGTASFISEMGVLKRVARTGWWFTGNKQPGSVAEHSFRVGVIGSVLAMMEGVDPPGSP